MPMFIDSRKHDLSLYDYISEEYLNTDQLIHASLYLICYMADQTHTLHLFNIGCVAAPKVSSIFQGKFRENFGHKD